MSRPSRILSAGSNWFAFAASLAVAFFLTPHLIRSLGSARYDIWCVVEAILAYFTLLDLGVGACLVRSVARYHAGKDSLARNKVASCSLAVFSAGGVIILAVGVPLTFLFSSRLGERIGDSADVFGFMLLMMANLAIALPFSVFPAILDGLERFTEKSIVRLIALALKTAGYLAVTWNEGTLLPLAIISLVVTLLEQSAFAFLCFRFLPDLRFSKSMIDRATLREVWGFSRDAFLAMLAGRISLQTGAILIGLFLPAGQVTAFATAARLIDYAKTLLRNVTTTITPGIAAMEAKGDWPGIQKLFLTGTKVVLYLVLPVNVGLILFGEAFLHRWVGAEVALAGYPPLVVLAMTLSLGVAQSMAGRILYGLGQLRWYARLALMESIVNVGLTLALIKLIGVLGVALAVTIPNIAFCICTIVMACRAVGLRNAQFLQVWIKPILATCVAILTWIVIGPAEASWPAIFQSIFVGLIPYSIAVICLEWKPRRKSTSAANHLLSLTGIRNQSGMQSGRPADASHS